MKISTVIGYVQMVIGGVYVLIAAILVALQWGNSCSFSLFGQNRTLNTAHLILAAAVTGILSVFMCKLLYRGAVTVHKSRLCEPGPAEPTPPAA
ncbi:MAG: hypothetical protein WC869_02975 [Phycisphaerae bacterium]|jgi:hypothetical protein